MRLGEHHHNTHVEDDGGPGGDGGVGVGVDGEEVVQGGSTAARFLASQLHLQRFKIPPCPLTLIHKLLIRLKEEEEEEKKR